MKITLFKANKKHIQDVGLLFDMYRQFYKYNSEIKSSTSYIKKRILNKESNIFVSYCDNDASGFVQLYETFDSLNINKKLVLYDLYVKKIYRNKGIGKLLMNKAKEFGIKKNYKIIELSTAISNNVAQSLYESLDYKRDTEYYNYYLELK